MKKYACDLEKGDMIKVGSAIQVVEKVENNFWDNFCFISTSSYSYKGKGKKFKISQTNEFEIIK